MGMRHTNERRTWKAMQKFANNEPLTEREWEALSWLTLIDRNRLKFELGNCRWATTKAECADNLAFYQSLGRPIHHEDTCPDCGGIRDPEGRLEMWLCRCDCGREMVVSRYDLEHGISTECSQCEAEARKHIQ